MFSGSCLQCRFGSVFMFIHLFPSCVSSTCHNVKSAFLCTSLGSCFTLTVSRPVSRVLSFPFVSSCQLSCLVLSSQRFHPGLRLSSIGFLCLAFCSLCFCQSSQSPLAFCFVVFCAANNKGFHLSIVCIWFHLFLFTQSTLAYHDTNR